MLERRDWNIRQVLWKGAENSNIAKIHQAGQLSPARDCGWTSQRISQNSRLVFVCFNSTRVCCSQKYVLELFGCGMKTVRMSRIRGMKPCASPKYVE
jgi:hypothetical protein